MRLRTEEKRFIEKNYPQTYKKSKVHSLRACIVRVDSGLVVDYGKYEYIAWKMQFLHPGMYYLKEV